MKQRSKYNKAKEGLNDCTKEQVFQILQWTKYLVPLRIITARKDP